MGQVINFLQISRSIPKSLIELTYWEVVYLPLRRNIDKYFLIILITHTYVLEMANCIEYFVGCLSFRNITFDSKVLFGKNVFHLVYYKINTPNTKSNTKANSPISNKKLNSSIIFSNWLMVKRYFAILVKAKFLSGITLTRRPGYSQWLTDFQNV